MNPRDIAGERRRRKRIRMIRRMMNNPRDIAGERRRMMNNPRDIAGETDRQTDRDRGGLGWSKCKRVKGKRSRIDHVKTLPACKANIYHSRTGMHAREKRLAINKLY